MKSEDILLYSEMSSEYKGWLIHIYKDCSFLKHRFTADFIDISINKKLFSKEIAIGWRWVDLLGNNKRMLEDCLIEAKKYIDDVLGEKRNN